MMNNEKNNHVIRDLDNGGFVLVLNNGAEIDGQAEAMLQALHSRSTGGIKSHLKILEEKGAEDFMEKFYVGYGHKSIGDCGSATVFVEGISMLAAKAIQDWRLYSGQEASTRYVDFSKQKFLDPTGKEEGKEVLENWRKFYLKAQEPVRKHLKKQFPKGKEEDINIYEKAIKARAFDITRSFLPAGATTNVAWRMNFRQFADELMLLRHHPLKEVRDIAEKTEEALKEMYPSSFGHERFAHTEEYNKKWMRDKYYYKNESAGDFELIYDNVDRKMLSEYGEVLKSRPMKTELPAAIGECGTVAFEFLLDFGSFRDFQRHRAIVQRMPLLVMIHGFNEWYLDALPENLREKAEKFIKEQERKIEKIDASETDKQYFMAMGYRVPCRFSGDLKALVYLTELRSTRFVHPTLVEQILKMINNMKELFEKDGLVFHLDEEPNRFDVRRGEQDIIEKHKL
ncbi:MAG: FAD-dependent thymidylate synthase [Candidatus Moranbacteria bacterium]|nr:FAD-dependent thymidylate synthase [Candidatus Moranbacteria bacterium]